MGINSLNLKFAFYNIKSFNAFKAFKEIKSIFT